MPIHHDVSSDGAAVSGALRDRWSHSGHVGNTRRRRLITCCRLLPTARRFWPGHLNIAHSAWMHGTLWNAIFTSLIASEIDVIDTLRFNNDVDYLYPLATVLEMRLNHEYWCEPECTWQTNNINKTTTSERLDNWASRLWRGIELVFKSLDCFTVRPIFSTRPITRMRSFSFYSFIYIFFIYLFIIFYLFIYFFFWGGGAQLQCIYYLVLYTDNKAEGN